MIVVGMAGLAEATFYYQSHRFEEALSRIKQVESWFADHQSRSGASTAGIELGTMASNILALMNERADAGNLYGEAQ